MIDMDMKYTKYTNPHKKKLRPNGEGAVDDAAISLALFDLEPVSTLCSPLMEDLLYFDMILEPAFCRNCRHLMQRIRMKLKNEMNQKERLCVTVGERSDDVRDSKCSHITT
jgi:hypothetical protein